MTRPKRDVSKLAGLLTLAAEAGRPATREVTSLPVTLLTPGSGQPRRAFDPLKLEQLTISIRERGVLQPLLVRPVGENYEIVAGERRWRAAQQAGLQEVPVLVRELTPEEAQQLALIENLQREDLNAVDEVDAKLALVALTLGVTPNEARSRLLQMLREPPSEDHAQIEGLFQVLGETWPYFAKNKLRILNWPLSILNAVRAGLPFTVAGVIVTAPTEAQADLLEHAKKGASREELRQAINTLKNQPASTSQVRIRQVARALNSSRWIGQLDSRQKKALDRWLEQMPETLKETLKP